MIFEILETCERKYAFTCRVEGKLPEKLRPVLVGNGPLYQVPVAKCSRAISLMSSLGKMEYAGQKLIYDCFTEYNYTSYSLKSKKSEYLFEECDLVIAGDYHFFVTSPMLFCIENLPEDESITIEDVFKEMRSASSKKNDDTISDQHGHPRANGSLCPSDHFLSGSKSNETSSTACSSSKKLSKKKTLKNSSKNKSQKESLNEKNLEKKTGDERQKGEVIIETFNPLPVLKLSCNTGMFANLLVENKSETLPFFKYTELYKDFENDLLETSFIKKKQASSNYYCPSPMVKESLTFLKEMGWKVVTNENLAFSLQTAISYHMEQTDDEIQLNGTVSFLDGDETISVPLAGVLTHSNKRHGFLPITPEKVGLFSFPKHIQDLSSCKVKDGKIVIKREEFGLLSPLVEDIRSNSCLVENENEKDGVESITLFRPFKEVTPGSGFCGELYPYQLKGLQWLHYLKENKLHGLLADEMGLGKTVQLLAFFSLLGKNCQILVVAPASLIFNWAREISKFLPDMPVHVYTGPKREIDFAILEGVVLTTYGTLRQDVEKLEKNQFDLVVLDESQTIKNKKSIAHQVAIRLQAKMRVSLTGTPIENSLDDLFSQMSFLVPNLLDRYTLEINEKKAAPYILRRQVDEVLTDFPEKIEQDIYVDMDKEQEATYQKYIEKSQKSVSLGEMEVFEAILRLRQVAIDPMLVNESAKSSKREKILQDIEEVCSEGHKVIVLSQFTSMLKLLIPELSSNHLYLDGATKNREKIIDSFQTDDNYPILLMSLKAGGVGLNLTKAKYVFLVDPWWNEAVEAQAIARAYRLGQKNTVIARRYITANTIEEKVMELKKGKLDLAESALNSNELNALIFT